MLSNFLGKREDAGRRRRGGLNVVRKGTKQSAPRNVVLREDIDGERSELFSEKGDIGGRKEIVFLLL
jgi:hypothetical protein